jgi:hypothetical protein
MSDVMSGRGARPPAEAALTDFIRRKLRGRDRCGQIEFLATQQALVEPDLGKAATLRAIGATAGSLSRKPQQLEFDFFGAGEKAGNFSFGRQFLDTINGRLITAARTTCQQSEARSVLLWIGRWIGYERHVCEKTEAELAKELDMGRGHLARVLGLLEKIGAITRVTRRGKKVIAVTPEGIYRGDVTRHATAVERYQAEIAPWLTGEPGR